MLASTGLIRANDEGRDEEKGGKILRIKTFWGIKSCCDRFQRKTTYQENHISKKKKKTGEARTEWVIVRKKESQPQ